MKNNIIFMAVFLLTTIGLSAQQYIESDSIRQRYLLEQKKLGQSFSTYFYSDFPGVHSVSENLFVFMIDSVRNMFDSHLEKYSKDLDKAFITSQKKEIKYYFDKLILDYPANHKTYTGETIVLSSTASKRLKQNLDDFNKPELLANTDFTEYVKAYIHHQTTEELKKNTLKDRDNQHFTIAWQLIPTLFNDQRCRDFWRYNYLYHHIDNIGIKNIDKIYNNFLTTCKDSAYINKIRGMYANDSAGRQGHLIRTYKSVGKSKLDAHIFLPDSVSKNTQRPAIIFFHGGSWSEGKPDWFFESCRSYAKKGWVACAVEYRIVSRHNSSPFDAVKDARSAIRWLRKNAPQYLIDTNRIIASGNSAGGHLVLATALADQWNEKTDDLKYNAIPNIILVNSGVYDLTDRNTAWIGAGLTDKNLVKQISPNHLIKKVSPCFLIIHGTNDRNCPYPTAEEFVQKMKQAGNNIEFHPLEGAGHFIWYDPKFSGQVSSIRSGFLKKQGY
jgi:acetyl esterase/lipase